MDDDRKMIFDVESRKICLTVTVKPANGMNEEHLIAIEKAVGARHGSPLKR